VDLRKRDLALRERIGNPAGLRKQPTRLAIRAKDSGLDDAGLIRRKIAKSKAPGTSTQSGPCIAPLPSTTTPRLS